MQSLPPCPILLFFFVRVSPSQVHISSEQGIRKAIIATTERNHCVETIPQLPPGDFRFPFSREMRSCGGGFCKS